MTIKVESTTDVKPVTPAKAEGTPIAKVEDKSAPEPKAPEQNASTESDTEEEKADKEEKDESEVEASDEDADTNDTEKEKPKKKGGFQRRIDKLNARNSAAQEELEYWKAQALKQKEATEPKKEPVTSVSETTDGKPSPDSFETHAEFVEALTDWKTEQKLKEREQKAEKSKLQEAYESSMRAHAERVKSFAVKTADFDDVIAEVDDIPVSAAFQGMIVESENGPELMYELAKNKAEFERIVKLSPLAAARELGKLESTLSLKAKETKQEPKKPIKVPEPISPVGSKGGVIEKSLDDPNLTQREYEALRAKQQRAS